MLDEKKTPHIPFIDSTNHSTYVYFNFTKILHTYFYILNTYVHLLGMDLVEGGRREFGFLGSIMRGDILGSDCCRLGGLESCVSEPPCRIL